MKLIVDVIMASSGDVSEAIKSEWNLFLVRLSRPFSTHAIHINREIDAFIVRAIDLTYFVMPVLQ